MKKILTCLLLTMIIAAPAMANDLPISIQADLDMYLGYKMGIRFDVNDKLDIVSGFGANVLFPTQYCFSTYASYKTMEIHDTWHIGVNFGVLQGVFDNTAVIGERYVYVNPGLSMYLTYPISDKIRIGAQGGMVFMIGYDRGRWGSSLEPIMGISFIYSE